MSFAEITDSMPDRAASAWRSPPPNALRTSVSGSDRSVGYAARFLGIGGLPYFQTGRYAIIILI